MKKLKFTRNIIIGVVALIIVAFIVNIAPGYKRDKYTDIVNLVIDENNVTENLKNNIYINENGTIYMSQEDIKNLFDENIYYDEKYNQIITTSYNKVSYIYFILPISTFEIFPFFEIHLFNTPSCIFM